MTYRIDLDGPATLAFQGLLDAAALADLRARITPGTHVVLRAGTEVDVELVDELRLLRAASVVAESPFLARWISQDR